MNDIKFWFSALAFLMLMLKTTQTYAQQKDSCFTDKYSLSYGDPIPADLQTLTIISANKSSDQTIENTALILYPNPVDKILRVSLDNDQIVIKKYQVSDINGRVIFIKHSLKNKEINVADLSKGVYVLSITLSNGNKVNRKFLKI